MSAIVLILKTKDHALVNYYMRLNLIMYVLSHALDPTGRYSVLSFRISTVFDIDPLELVRFRNSRYFVSSRSFSCPALSFAFVFVF